VRIAAAKSLKNAVNYTPVLFSEQMKTALRNEVAKALQGKESPQAAMDNAVKACNTPAAAAGLRGVTTPAVSRVRRQNATSLAVRRPRMLITGASSSTPFGSTLVNASPTGAP